MRRLTLWICLLSFACLPAGVPTGLAGQTIAERLTATGVENFVRFFKAGDAALEYTADVDDRSTADSVTGPIRLALKGGGNTLNIQLEFRSPYRYGVTVTETTVVDPVAQAVSEFLAAAGTLPGLAVSDDPTVAAAVESAKPTPPPGAPAAAAAAQADTSPASSTELLMWSMWDHFGGPGKYAPASAAANTLTELSQCYEGNGPPLRSKLYKADSTLFNEGVSEDPEGETPAPYNRTITTHGDFVRGFKVAAEILGADPADKAKLGTNLGQLDIIATRLKEANERAKKELAAAGEAPAFTWMDHPGCRVFEELTKDAVARFIVEGQKVLKVRERAATALAQLNTEGRKIFDILDDNGIRTIRRVNPHPDSVRVTTVVYKSRTLALADDGLSFKSTDGKPITLEIRTSRWSRFIAEFGVGVAYVWAEYPQFGTGKDAAGNTIIAMQDPKSENTLPVGMLTVIPNYRSGHFFPMFQFGVGSAEDKPALLVGGGFRFAAIGRVASITAGRAFLWRPTLSDGLSVGDRIDGTAELNNAIKNTLSKKSSWYLSFVVR